MPLWYGGDYNPDQWPEDIWAEDVTLMNRAGVNLATVGVFSWARLEPREGEYDFGWLDRVLDGLHAGGVRVDLATATASPPPWLTTNYPETRPVTIDGVTLVQGSRQAYCPSSPVYRAHAVRLVTALAERYGAHPSLELWHINNEYGCHVAHCYCEASTSAFRDWLRAKYGSVDGLNAAWGTAFWSQRYDSFDEVLPPKATPTFPNPSQLLDFDRFTSDELLNCYRAELAVLRRVTPDVPVTTNFMGGFRNADYWAWAREVDIVTDDSYPDPADPDAPAWGALARDLMRSLGGGAPWLLMEQAPSAVNWRFRNAVKAPGMMRAWSYQAVARGADGILFFQWRQSVVGAEKFHSGMVPHGGTDTRVWREIEQLGGELAALSRRGARGEGDGGSAGGAGTLGVSGRASIGGASTTLDAGVDAPVAVVFDWQSWWAIEQPATPSTLSYLDTVFAWHREFTARGLTVDFVAAGADLSAYQLVVVPTLFTVTDAHLATFDSYARAGGTLLVTYQTAVTDENLRVRAGGYLGLLADTLGVWVEEFAPPAGPAQRAMGDVAPPALAVEGAAFGGRATAGSWAEFVRVGTAEVMATFGEGSLTDWPAVTRNAVGGTGWYVATQPDAAGLTALVGTVLASIGLDDVVSVTDAAASRHVETVRRGGLTFVINHGASEVELSIDGTDVLTGSAARGLALGPQGVAIVEG